MACFHGLAKARCDLIGKPFWTALTVNQRHRHRRLEQERAAARNPLVKLEAGARHVHKTGFDLQKIVKPRGLQEIAGEVADHEHKIIQRRVADAQEPQAIRAATLAEGDVASVVNDAARVGILEVDPHRQHMDAALE